MTKVRHGGLAGWVAVPVLLATGAWADSCDGALTEAFVKEGPAEHVMTCVLELETGVDTRNDDGRTALHLAAAFSGNDQLVRNLLREGADPSLNDRGGRTPLGLAAQHATSAAVIVSLVAWGAAVDPGNGWGPGDRATTPLMLAAQRNDGEAVAAALLASGADPRWRDEEGSTALHLALRRADGSGVARMLLRAGAPVGQVDDEGYQPLHLAASYSTDVDLIRLLVEEGADVDAGGPDDVTPLMLAASRSTSPDVLAALTELSDDPCAKDAKTRTALTNASRNEALRTSDAYWRLNELCAAAP